MKVFTDMKKGLNKCDIVMMLRLQNERMQGSFLPSAREYYEFFGLTPDKLNMQVHVNPDIDNATRTSHEVHQVRLGLDWNL